MRLSFIIAKSVDLGKSYIVHMGFPLCIMEVDPTNVDGIKLKYLENSCTIVQFDQSNVLAEAKKFCRNNIDNIK